MSDELEAPVPTEQAEEPGDRLATLGEILEAHHLRFVAKVRQAQQKEQSE
jgi:hypothetical protein